MPAARRFLVRGLIAGLVAGVVAFGVAYLIGEPSLTAAIAVEEAGHPAGHGTEMVVIPRALQSSLGLLTGTVVAGTTLGGVVGLLSGLALGRFGALTPRASTRRVAGLGFVAVQLVPFSACPPNPPSIGRADTIG